VEAIAKKVGREPQIEAKLSGAELIGLRYQPPFENYHKSLGNVLGTVAQDPIEKQVYVGLLEKSGVAPDLARQQANATDRPLYWRADEDPLIQYPRKSWFIRTTRFRDEMLANNARINWLPEHIRDGRFGNFLESNVDWALSRERYWGTPLPIWVCEESGYME